MRRREQASSSTTRDCSIGSRTGRASAGHALYLKKATKPERKAALKKQLAEVEAEVKKLEKAA
jgi:thiamine monophosphate kinase